MDVLELLTIEVAALFGPAGPAGKAGRQLVVVCTRTGVTLIGGPTLPPSIADELAIRAARADPPADLLVPPPIVYLCRDVLEHTLGASSVLSSDGPSYLVADDLNCTISAAVERSDTPRSRVLQGANPGNWDSDEWNALIDGSLGPWAMATDNGEVVSICHTPLLTDQAAEAGTWTRPDHRGQGLAAATTAAWAAILLPTGRHCFYSTSSTNRSSQAVARRLGLPLLGTLWWFGPGPPLISTC